MVGAYDRDNSSVQSTGTPFGQAPASSSNSAQVAFDKAMAAIDKVLANPKATQKQIVNAMDKLNAATDKYANSLLNNIGTSSNTGSLPPYVADTFVPTEEPIMFSGSNLTATPPAPEPEPMIVLAAPVKTATPDIVLFDDSALPIDVMTDLIFENIGGQELISITRSDIVNGQKISYQPIKNLSSIQQQYNPNNILGLQQTSDRFFAGFSIKLEDKIPEVGNGLNGENVYFDESTGDLIIEFINLNNDEQIETQITVNGTIYEANLGDYTS
jgi:hypothetical protein